MHERGWLTGCEAIQFAGCDYSTLRCWLADGLLLDTVGNQRQTSGNERLLLRADLQRVLAHCPPMGEADYTAIRAAIDQSAV